MARDLGVPAFKLASIHIAEPYFLQYVAAKGKPMLVSTGMATLAEVDEAVQNTEKAAAPTPETLFDDVFAEMPAFLQEQRAELLDSLKETR